MTMTRNRDQLAICADIVKENVSALDAGRALGLEIRHGRCKCPIHGGHDYNCVLYPGNRGYVCHVCKSGGDVIKLVQRSIPDMSFVDALRWFNGTFGLGMDIDSPIDKKRLKQAKNDLKRKAEERAFQERLERIDFDMCLATDTVLARLEQQRDENRPRRYGEEWNDKFVEAVKLIPEVREMVEYFLMKCTKVKT